MTIRSCWSRVALLLVGVLFGLPREAKANTVSCTQAHAAGQREENAGHLKEALAYFQECASDADCPLPIRNECTSLYSTVENRLPTLVLSVIDDAGNDVTDVKVSSAETSIANSLDGRPIAVNPGLHELRFELPGGQTLTKSVVVRQGEKDRIVSVKLPRSEFGATAPAELRTEEVSTNLAPSKRYTVPVESWVTWGVGAAALGVWGTFGLLGRHQQSGLVDCSPNCASSKHDDYDTMKRDYLIADISLGVGAAALVAGTVLLLTKGHHAQPGADRRVAGKSKRSFSVAPVALGRVGGGLMLGGRY